jgi:hypothetical protein
MLLVASVVAVVLSAAATALAASPSHNDDSAKGNSANNKDFAGLVDIGGGRKMYMGVAVQALPRSCSSRGAGTAPKLWAGAQKDDPSALLSGIGASGGRRPRTL